MDSDSADDIFSTLMKDQEAEGLVYDVIYDAVKDIGGYSNGSDIYDDGDTVLAMNLLNIADGESDEWSMDYDNVEDIKEAYANDVIAKMTEDKEPYNLVKLEAFKSLYKHTQDAGLFDGTVNQLAAAFLKSGEFANEVYENLTRPRG